MCLTPSHNSPVALRGSDEIISYGHLTKAGRVLKAFAFMYLPFYGLSTEFLFDNFGIFSYLSAFMYRVDILNENGDPSSHCGLDSLKTFLHARALLDERIAHYLEEIHAYLHFERRCQLSHCSFTREQLQKMIFVKSHDFRILHAVCLNIVHEDFDPVVEKMYRNFEMLFEIEDDLSTYQEDVHARVFNAYGLLVRIKGPRAKEDMASILHRAKREMWKAHAYLDWSYRSRFLAIYEWYRAHVPSPKIPEPIIRVKPYVS